MEKEDLNVIWGYVASNALAIAVIATIYLIHGEGSMGSFLGISTFLLVPVLMGMTCAWFWRSEKTRYAIKMTRILWNMLASFLLAMIFVHEGMICLIIVSPLIYLMMLTGLSIGNIMFQEKNDKLNFTVSGLFLVLFIWDARTPHHFENEVRDEMIVHATPAKIWPYVVSYPEIKAKSHYWFFNIGLPKPIGTSVTGNKQGEGRKCIFENNMVFDEIMSTYQPGQNLTFDVVKQPQDPELMGHINIEKGQFILKDNHDGTTTLIGTSWYSLNVFPAMYFDLWAQSITRNVHVRVMEHIKSLAEKN